MLSLIEIRRVASACITIAALSASIGPASASEQNTANSQGAYRSAPSRLQVTGSRDKLTVDVERADVQSTLKAVLKQAGQQFAPDANATGTVTLLLTDQPLDTVLHAVCDQCYLRFTTDPSGIYKFSRDEEAIKKAFTQLKQLNTQLRAQLRSMGLDVPSDELIADVRLRGGGFGGGSFGATVAGAAPGGPQTRGSLDSVKPDRDRRSTGNNALGQPAPSASEPAPTGLAGRASYPPALKKSESAAGKIANIHTDFIPQSEVYQLLGQTTRALNTQDYSQLIRQNGMVWFNIPEEKPEPVTTVLQLFGQQSNVPILVDRSIPSSLRFRVWGNLSPRPLPEALNVLAPTAHLQWRWIGNTVFVVPAPNFQISFGDQGSFRSQYPAQQRGESGGADTKDKRGGQE